MTYNIDTITEKYLNTSSNMDEFFGTKKHNIDEEMHTKLIDLINVLFRESKLKKHTKNIKYMKTMIKDASVENNIMRLTWDARRCLYIFEFLIEINDQVYNHVITRAKKYFKVYNNNESIVHLMFEFREKRKLEHTYKVAI